MAVIRHGLKVIVPAARRLRTLGEDAHDERACLVELIARVSGRWLRRAATVAVASVLTAWVAMLAAPLASRAAAPSSPAVRNCPRLVFLFSRGSGESLSAERGLGRAGFPLYTKLVERYGQSNIAPVANQYPAVAVTFADDAADRKLRVPHLLTYRRSVAAGVRNEVRSVVDLAIRCPRSYLLLGGYSQGAQVTRQAFADLPVEVARRVGAVALFGDPYFSANEARVRAFGGFDPRRSGLLRRFHLGRPAGFTTATPGEGRSWCHPLDGVCQAVLSRGTFNAHGTYGADAQSAALEIANRLRGIGVTIPTPVVPQATHGTVDFYAAVATIIPLLLLAYLFQIRPSVGEARAAAQRKHNQSRLRTWIRGWWPRVRLPYSLTNMRLVFAGEFAALVGLFKNSHVGAAVAVLAWIGVSSMVVHLGFFVAGRIIYPTWAAVSPPNPTQETGAEQKR